MTDLPMRRYDDDLIPNIEGVAKYLSQSRLPIEVVDAYTASLTVRDNDHTYDIVLRDDEPTGNLMMTAGIAERVSDAVEASSADLRALSLNFKWNSGHRVAVDTENAYYALCDDIHRGERSGREIHRRLRSFRGARSEAWDVIRGFDPET